MDFDVFRGNLKITARSGHIIEGIEGIDDITIKNDNGDILEKFTSLNHNYKVGDFIYTSISII